MRLGVLIVAAALAACSTDDAANTQNPGDPSAGSTGGRQPVDTRGSEGDNFALQTVYFDYDDSTLRPDAREALRKNATFLKSNTGVAVEVQGNCDERGTEEYNLALGKRRAEAAKSYLVDLGVNSSRVATVSFGEEKPVAVGHDEASWAKNRRGDFVVRD
jgi:peptidoglycan-associated lipoprotein